MSGSYAVIGRPINPAGVWLQPPHLAVATAGAASPGIYVVTQGDYIPLASLGGGAAEASALIGIGNATVVG